MSGPVLSRHELLWVVEQCGGGAWPYPLRAVTWDADTEDDAAAHRRAVERALRGRGLLEAGPAAVLLAVGELVMRWRVAVDLVHRSPDGPRAAVGLADAPPRPGERAALLVSAEHADAPVRVDLVPADRLAEAVVATVPAVAPGRGPALDVAADAFGGPDAGGPATCRTLGARRAARSLLAGATGWGQVGAVVRRGADADPVRPAGPVTWLDGPHGRWRIRHDRSGGTPRALLDPVDAAGLAARVRDVAGAAAAPGGRSSGRSSG